MKRFLILILLSIMLILLASCQPNPDNPIVVNKGDGKLADLITQENHEQYKFDYTDWKEKYIAYDDNISKVPIHVFADAYIKVPEVKQFPIVNIKQRNFSKNDLKTMTEIFFSGDIKSSGSGYMTPEEISQAIVELKQTIYKLQNNTEINSEGTISHLEDKIKQYENKLSNSVEFASLTSVDWDKINDDPVYVSLSSLDNGKTSAILINNSASNESRMAYYESKYAYLIEFGSGNVTAYQPNGQKSPQGTRISLNEAIQLADNVVEKLDKDMQYYGYSIRTKEQFEAIWEVSSVTNECYVLHYTRQIQNVPITYTSQSAQYSGEYGEPWNYEYMTFYVDDTGIIAFAWDNPKQVFETLNSNVALLPFEKIKDCFKKQVIIKNATLSDFSEYYDYTIMKVSRVELGMTIVKKKDTKDEFMAIPVWDFFGGLTWAYTDKAMKEWKESKKIYDTITWEDLSELTINAIDGSIIDRSLGY